MGRPTCGYRDRFHVEPPASYSGDCSPARLRPPQDVPRGSFRAVLPRDTPRGTSRPTPLRDVPCGSSGRPLRRDVPRGTPAGRRCEIFRVQSRARLCHAPCVQRWSGGWGDVDPQTRSPRSSCTSRRREEHTLQGRARRWVLRSPDDFRCAMPTGSWSTRRRHRTWRTAGTSSTLSCGAGSSSF